MFVCVGGRGEGGVCGWQVLLGGGRGSGLAARRACRACASLTSPHSLAVHCRTRIPYDQVGDANLSYLLKWVGTLELQQQQQQQQQQHPAAAAEGVAAPLLPVLFLSHLDVVPVANETLSNWTHPPFSGAVAGGYVWGRGALDDKVGGGVRSCRGGGASKCTSGMWDRQYRARGRLGQPCSKQPGISRARLAC